MGKANLSGIMNSFHELKYKLLELENKPFIHKEEIEKSLIKLWKIKGDIMNIYLDATELKNGSTEKYRDKNYLDCRSYIFQRIESKCCKCGSQKSLHLDHIKPVSKYPEQYLNKDNMQILCEVCNLEKSNKNENDYRTRDKIVAITSNIPRFID